MGQFRKYVQNKAHLYHERIPGVRKLPLAAIGIIVAVAFANALAWVATGIVLVREHRDLCFAS